MWRMELLDPLLARPSAQQQIIRIALPSDAKSHRRTHGHVVRRCASLIQPHAWYTDNRRPATMPSQTIVGRNPAARLSHMEQAPSYIGATQYTSLHYTVHAQHIYSPSLLKDHIPGANVRIILRTCVRQGKPGELHPFTAKPWPAVT